jgi:hypothetical protein
LKNNQETFEFLKRETGKKELIVWTIESGYITFTPLFNRYFRHNLIAVACKTAKRIETMKTARRKHTLS